MTAFAITYDYLCPFARNANETVVEALQAGAAYDVTFRPFSLTQNHATEQDIPVWERDLTDPGSGVLAHQFGLAIRDEFPTSFLRFHPAMFAARHDAGRDINDVTVVRDVVASIGLDPDEVGAVVASGRPAKTLEVEHTALVEDHAVFGVPTFISGDDATFVRFMDRHTRADLDRVVGMLSWTNLNEFKRTRVPR